MAAHGKHPSKTPPEPGITCWSASTGIGQSAWQALGAHHEKVRVLHLRDLFAHDPKRGEPLTAEAVGLFLDYSNNRIASPATGRGVRLAQDKLLSVMRFQFGGHLERSGK